MLSAPVDDAAADFADLAVDDIIEDEIDSESAIDEAFYKQISISVTEKMRMREVLTQMAALAGVNIFIAQDIEGSISFTAKNRPFLDILKDICSSSGLKYKITGTSVKVEYDSPMLSFYRIPSLNIQRDTQSSMTISTDIFSGSMLSSDTDTTGKNANFSSANNGSNSTIFGKGKNDFWSELEAALKTIIGESEGNYISIHRQGGLISAYTTHEKHEEIKKYIKLLKDASEAQVLIEAKIIEVDLKDEFKSGINWHILRKGGAKVDMAYNTTELFSAGINRENLSVVSGFIERFGAVKTLSSPRITILNNHSAVLKVAKNEVVYLPEFQKQYSGRNSDNITDMLSSNMKTIPIGLIMTVQPSIDLKNNTVLLTLRPTISKIAGYKEIPFLFNNYYARGSGTSGQVSNSAPTPQTQKVPILDVREMDSVLKVNSGQIVVMGGLMHEKSNNNRSGLPGFENTPIDFVAGERDKGTEVTELVIFLRATILRKSSKTHHNADEKVYNTFASDPRRLKFKK
jgi:general secretion pathway protein D